MGERGLRGSAVEFRTDGMCAHLVLDHAQGGSMLRSDTVAALVTGLREAEASPDCRLLVLSGTDGVFCSGLDARCVAADEAWERRDNMAFWKLLVGLRDSRLVTVAAVDGSVTGGGVGLAAACDLVLAGPRATFRMTEVLLGLVPALITPFVADRIGRHRLFHAAIRAQPIDADAAVGIGLADEAPASLDTALRDLMRALRRMPRDVVADLKSCHAMLADASVSPTEYAEHAHRLFEAAASNVAVRQRVAALRASGAL